MSDFDKDFAHFQASSAKPANYDDFERLDDFPIREQPEAEALAETGAPPDFSALQFGQGPGGLHSTDRPLVTEDLPPVAVCPGPATQSAEIHLTPDPEELKAEPFIDITAGHVGGIPDQFDPRPSAPPEPSLFDPYGFEPEVVETETVTSAFAAHSFSEELVEVSDRSAQQQLLEEFDPQPTIAVCPPRVEDLVAPLEEERVESYVEEREARPSDKEQEQGEERKCTFHPRAWFKPSKIDPRVAELIYWRDVKKSGGVFGSGLVVLLSLTYFSFISVVSYLLLGVMTGTLSYRIYKNVLQAVQKSGEGHPFKEYLEFELSLPSDKVQAAAETTIKHLECTAKELRRLFLVEDLVDSLKFAVMLWCFTYIGAWFNGLTLFIIGFILLFTLPKVYETYQEQIDVYLNIACTQISGIINTVKAKLPVGKKPKTQ